MYNKERKEMFLQYKNENALIGNNLRNAFVMAESIENNLGKDMAEWSSAEILDFYRMYSTKNIQTLIVLHNALREYTGWCLLNNLVRDNQNHYDEIDSNALCKCVDINSLRESVPLDRDVFVREIRTLPNYQDQFILLGLYEGISLDDLINVKISDLDGRILHLHSGVDYPVSPELQHIIFEAANETVYDSLKGNRHYDYVPAETIIKSLDPTKLRGSVSNPRLVATGRMRKCSDFLGYNLTVKNIREAGRINYIRKKIMEPLNLSFEEALLSHRKEHENIFGRIQNIQTYMKTYGEFALNLDNQKSLDG